MPWTLTGNIKGPPGGGGSDPWTVLKLAADQANSLIAAADIAALGFTPVANRVYLIRASILVTAAAATTGVKLGLAFPTGVTGAYTITVPNTATASNLLNGSTSGTLTANTAGLTTMVQATIEAHLITGASVGAGNIRPVIASEVAASAVTAKAGSALLYRTL